MKAFEKTILQPSRGRNTDQVEAQGSLSTDRRWLSRTPELAMTKHLQMFTLLLSTSTDGLFF